MTLLEKVRTRSKKIKAEVARQANISRSHYGRIEIGKTRASLEVAFRISSALDQKISPIQIMKIGPVAKPSKKAAA